MKNFAPTLTMANGNAPQRKKGIIKRVSWSLDQPTHDRENIQHDEMVSEAKNYYTLFLYKNGEYILNFWIKTILNLLLNKIAKSLFRICQDYEVREVNLFQHFGQIHLGQLVKHIL